jgi:VWFA-related protein
MTMRRAKISRSTSTLFLLFTATLAFALLAALPSNAQSPDGPMAPRPDVIIQKAPAAPAPVRVQVTLINTPVAVQNKQGDMIHNLDAKDFQVTDNGIPQQITHFDLGSDPISIVILVENSSRIAPLLPEIRKTGILFTQTVLGPRGEAAVVSFNDGVDKLQDFTANHDEIESTVAQIPAGGSGAKLFDAMAVSVEMLAGRPPKSANVPNTRRILMIVAEALDIGSSTKLGEILRQAQLANITIYSVGLSTARGIAESKSQPDDRLRTNPAGTMGLPGPPGSIHTPETDDAMSGVDLTGLAKIAVQQGENQVRDHALLVATAATGGIHVSTFKDQSIEKAIDQIGGELHSQYNIGYVPTDATVSGYHQIKVTLDGKQLKDLKVRARPGYYLP